MDVVVVFVVTAEVVVLACDVDSGFWSLFVVLSLVDLDAAVAFDVVDGRKVKWPSVKVVAASVVVVVVGSAVDTGSSAS